MAMKIGSKYKFDDVLPRHWNQFADATELSEVLLLKRLRVFASALPVAARNLQKDNPEDYVNNRTVEKIISLIDERCEITINRLKSGAL